jgi:hypothetical protein
MLRFAGADALMCGASGVGDTSQYGTGVASPRDATVPGSAAADSLRSPEKEPAYMVLVFELCAAG